MFELDHASSFRYADLFAGVGGFAAALSGMGGEPAYAVEIDAAAAAVYKRNWGHDPLGDITKDATDTVMRVPAHDVLVGGFPCQPFSKSGAQLGMDETRGTLFFNIMQVVRSRRPTLIVLENVRNLVGPRHAHEWAVIIDQLRAAGYQVSDRPAIFSPHEIAPSHGGTPQVRERVFITATLVPEGHVADPHVNPIEVPMTARKDGTWDLETDLPLDDSRTVPGTALTKDERRWIEHWDKWVQKLRKMRTTDARATGEPVRPLPGFPIWANVWTHDDDERMLLMHPRGVKVPGWKANFLTKNWELYDAMRKRGDARWLASWLRVTHTFPESRQKLEWQAQDAESLMNCVISLRPSGLRAKKPSHLPALVAIAQTPILMGRERRLSPREAARLQGLPNTFEFGAQSDAATYKQMGNGVNTGVVWNVVKAHVQRDRTLLEATEPGRRILAAVQAAPNDPRSAIAEAVRRGQARYHAPATNGTRTAELLTSDAL